jgi:hypothetical protein
MANLLKTLADYFFNKTLLVVVILTLVFTACVDSTGSNNLVSKPVPAIKEFRELYIAKGDLLVAGYTRDELNKAATATQVIERFGNPSKSEDGNLYTTKLKVLYFAAKDEFGNPCLARLRFINDCKSQDPSELRCHALIGVETAPQ